MIDTVNWIFEHCEEDQIDSAKVVMMGNSAGDNLAIVTQMRLLAQKFSTNAEYMEFPGKDSEKF